MPERPLDWREQPLGEIADIRLSNVDKKSRSGEYPVQLCNYLDVYREDYLNETQPYMWATATRREIETFGLLHGDVVITKDSESPHDIGVPAVIDRTPQHLVCGYHLAVIRPRGMANSTWLAKQLDHPRVQRYFACVATGSTRYALSSESIRSVPIWLPPFAEQVHAAKILRKLDETIRKTEHMIVKLQQMEKGLHKDLLTLGLDENGEIRNPDHHPEQFKDSEMGPVPKHWRVTSLMDLVRLANGQRNPRVEPYRSWVLVAPDHVEQATGRLLDRKTAAEQGAISGKYEIEPGDVVYSKIRPYLRKAILADFRGLCSADMYPLRPQEGTNPRFLLALVLGEHFSRFADAVSMRSGFPKVNREELGEYRAVVPPRSEQDRIAAILQTWDSRLLCEERQLGKLRSIRRGLSHDLLTGRVRALASEEAPA